jgi:hypothetical protein
VPRRILSCTTQWALWMDAHTRSEKWASEICICIYKGKW